MSLQISINLWVILAIVGMVVGFVVFMTGIMAAADPEGRAGNLVHLVPAGFLIFLFAAIYCLYRFGAVLGFWG